MFGHPSFSTPCSTWAKCSSATHGGEGATALAPSSHHRRWSSREGGRPHVPPAAPRVREPEGGVVGISSGHESRSGASCKVISIGALLGPEGGAPLEHLREAPRNSGMRLGEGTRGAWAAHE